MQSSRMWWVYQNISDYVNLLLIREGMTKHQCLCLKYIWNVCCSLVHLHQLLLGCVKSLKRFVVDDLVESNCECRCSSNS